MFINRLDKYHEFFVFLFQNIHQQGIEDLCKRFYCNNEMHFLKNQPGVKKI